MIYQMNKAIIGYPGNVLIESASLEVKNKEKIAIVGRNGCGKTTLLKVIAGKMDTDNLDSDEEFFISMDGKPRIGYLEQINFDKDTITVREELMKAFEEIIQLKEKLSRLEKEMEEDATEKMLNEYDKTASRYEMLGGYTCLSELENVFVKFGFDITDLDRRIDGFSGGQRTKIAFAKLILSKPDIMLLDEPTNHLDMPTIEWLEGYLKNYAHAVIIVSHDRMFLDRITDVTYEIEYKRMKRYPGNYTDFLNRKQLNYEKQCKDYEAQQKEIERLTFFIEKWKNTPTKVAMTRSKRMQIEHMVKIPKPLRFNTRTIHSSLQPGRKSAKEVLTVKSLEIGYDEVLSKVSFELLRGQKLAIIGENGKGKSTLLKTLVKQLNSFSGSADFGKDVDWVYFDQELLNLDESKTVIDEFWDEYPNLDRTKVRTILGNFLFCDDDVFQPITQLSGGERVRLSLAKLMKKQANLLILDEPTNHLDMAGKEALEGMLGAYEGTLLFVSHDRYFVQSIADSLLVFEENSVKYYPYGYAKYWEERASSLYSENQPAKSSQTGQMDRNRHQLGGSDFLKQAGGMAALINKTKSTPASADRQAGRKQNGFAGADIDLKREKARRERRLEKIESEISAQEDVVNKWKLKFTDPEIAADYEKLNEISTLIASEEEKLNTLLMEWSGLV